MDDGRRRCGVPVGILSLPDPEGEKLISPWSRRTRGTGRLPPRPKQPNELWQTDLRYVKIGGRTYYLLVFLDVFSRFVTYWELLRWMDGETVSLSALSALETLPERARTTAHSSSGSTPSCHCR